MINLPIPTYKEEEFRAYNSGGVEREVGEFLYGFVRVLKPTYILETGTHKGISSSFMGLGLKENGKGLLQTIEFDENHWEESQALWKQMGVEKFIQLFKTRVENFTPEGEYDMLFHDSEPEFRWGELERFYPNLKPGGYAFIHDLHRHWCKGTVNTDHPQYENWPFGKIPESILTLLKNRDLVPFHLPTPRGLSGFYKKHQGDYQI